MAPWCDWTIRPCRRRGRPAFSTTAIGCWAAGSSPDRRYSATGGAASAAKASGRVDLCQAAAASRAFRGCSLVMRGSIADWETWTGLACPDSGSYVVAGATSPVAIDRDRGEGVYFDQNVWIVHDLR